MWSRVWGYSAESKLPCHLWVIRTGGRVHSATKVYRLGDFIVFMKLNEITNAKMCI